MSIISIDIQHKGNIYEDYKEDHYWYDPISKQMNVYNCTYLELKYDETEQRMKPNPIDQQIKTNKKYNNLDKINKILNEYELEILFKDNNKVITQVNSKDLEEVEYLLDNQNLTFEIISA